MTNPLISIIIPTYNRADLISETLNSVVAQTHENWECIIVDDGSTDNTANVILEYTNKDKRFKYYLRPGILNKGASPCRNYGLKQAKGDYIQFLDSDDLLNKNKFLEQLKLMENSPALTITTCRWGSFTNSSALRIKTKYNSYKDFERSIDLLHTFGKFNEYFPPLVYLVPAELVKMAGYWNEIIVNNPNDDGEYFTRIIMNANRILFCENAEVYYRAGDSDRLSLLNEERKVLACMDSWSLIENHLKDHHEISKVYIKNGKRNIYNQIKNSRPDIVDANAEFFKEVIPFKKRFYNLFGK